MRRDANARLDRAIQRLTAERDAERAAKEAAEAEAVRLREGIERLAERWQRQAEELAFPDEDERQTVEAEDALRLAHADELRALLDARQSAGGA